MPAAKGFETYRDYDWMYQKYVVEELSLVEVAEVANCNSATILAWLRELGIPVRSRVEGYRLAIAKGKLSRTPEQREACSKRAKMMWASGAYKNVSSEKARRKHSKDARAAWARGVFTDNSVKLRAAHERGCYDGVPDKIRAAFARGAYDGVFHSPTSIEIATREALARLGIDYVEQYRPDGCFYIYDFLLPEYNMLLEVQGEYWHRLEGMVLRDVKKRLWAMGHGYCVTAIWGDEVRENASTNLIRILQDCPGVTYEHFQRFMCYG